MYNKQKYALDAEEKEILKYFETDSLLSLPDSSKIETIEAVDAANNFLKKSKRINIRINGFDLNHIKRKAAQEGMPYQTLISSILHKYASGSS